MTGLKTQWVLLIKNSSSGLVMKWDNTNITSNKADMDLKANIL